MPVNLTHALAFHAVAEAGSYTAAARREAVSQPTLSAQVRALEAATGRRLFARAGRGVRLTPEGEALLGATRELVRAIAGIEAQLAGAKAQPTPPLRVSADSAIHALPVLAELKRRRPVFAFTIQIANSAAAIAHVLADEADVAVAARAVKDRRLAAQRLRDDRLVIVAAAGDPIAAAGPASLAALGGRPLVLRERGSITRAATEAALGVAGVPLHGALEVETREAVLEAVAAGFGCGLVFASEAGSDPRLARIEIADQGVDVAEYVICRAGRAGAPLVRDFLAAAADVAAARGWLKPA
jgi:LysR family transcriptional regulator, low CO2-responsive transcriptional regulator